jgi:hypothetical protein
MSNYNYSAVCVVSAENLHIGNQLAEALGHGPNNHSVALSPNGSEPATHYACRAQVNDVFVAMVMGAAEGGFPEIDGLTPEQIAGAFSVMQIDIQPAGDGYQHFIDYTSSLGLQRVMPEEI